MGPQSPKQIKLIFQLNNFLAARMEQRESSFATKMYRLLSKINPQKEIYENQELIASLKCPALIESYPLSVKLCDLGNSFIIERFISAGSEVCRRFANIKGAVYEGYFALDQNKTPAILKAYYTSKGRMKSALSFSNEVSSLTVLSRLIYSNFENRLVIQEKINGKLLAEELIDCFTSGEPNGFYKYLKNHQDAKMAWGGYEDLIENHASTSPSNSNINIVVDGILGNFAGKQHAAFKNDESERKYYRLIEKYRILPTQLHQMYHLIHNDIHPYNVIVDGNENLYLIDFGRAAPLDADKDVAQRQIDYENYVALSNIEYFKVI